VTCIARWDGSSWSVFDPTIFSGSTDVFALTVYNGDLVVGGWMSSHGCVVRWDGAAWHTLGSGVDAHVETLAVLDGNLYVGGFFGEAGESRADYIARWDGAE
jgi:hypothetical protein